MAEQLRTIRSLGPWMAPLLATGVALMLLLVAFVLWQTLEGFNEVDEGTFEQRELLQDLADTRALARAVVDMETGLRGYLLTGREAFLEPYDSGRVDFAVTTLALRERWRGAPDQADALERMAVLEADWRQAFAMPLIERRRSSRLPVGRALEAAEVTEGEGKRRIDSLRALNEHLDARISAQVRALSHEIGRRLEQARSLALRTAFALLLAVGFMSAVISRGFRTAAERNLQLSHEIAERKQAEAAARAAEARFAAFLNGLSEALVIADDNGRILWTNPRLPALFGYAAEDLAGASVGMLLAERDRGALEERFTALRRESPDRVQFEVTARTASGAELPAEIAMSRFEAPSGPRIALVIRDISERRAVERLKSEFIASVSHELRTPLTAILGSLALLREGEVGRIDDDAREFVEMAHANGKRLARLVDDVIDIERIGSGALAFSEEDFALPDFLEETVRLNRGFGDAHGVAYRLLEPVPAVRLHGDRSRLMQAVTNLLSNAAKFSPRGEEVLLAAQPSGDGRVRLRVTDRGPGIPEAFRPRVFEKFAQADGSDRREKGGTGLGLAIARAIVTRLGGHIGFDTETGRGTTFWIDLPVE